MKAVSVVGLGYVGLCTAVCLSSRGFKVYGIDVDAKRLELVRRGTPPIHEEGLVPRLRAALRRKSLHCTSDLITGISRTDVTFIAVGTPSKPDGSIDLGYVRSASSDVGSAIREKAQYHVVALKSTVIPGTTEELVKPILEEKSGKVCGKGFGLTVNPEFLREGSAVWDTFNPDAIVIGSVDPTSSRVLRILYKKFYRRVPRIMLTTPSNAEMIKYSVNAFRAVQLSFLNTVANLCSTVPGADIGDVAKALGEITGADRRYLRAGLGYGGSCLPKDLRAFASHAENRGSSYELLRAAMLVNEMQPLKAVEMAKGLLGNLAGRQVAVLGLAFKANTDDVRESVALKVVAALMREGAQVTAYDPKAVENARRILPHGVRYAESMDECLNGADCCIVATEWDEFKRLRPGNLKQLMRTPVVVDGRRILDSARFEAEGFVYAGVGKSGKTPG